MDYLLLSAVAGFLTTLVLTRDAIGFLQSSGIVGIDQQKEDRPELPTSGGVAVLFGFLIAVSVYIGLATFAPGGLAADTEVLLAALSSTFVIGIIGLIDDIHIDREGVEDKGNEQVRVGLAQRYKYLAPVIAALPLMAVEAGITSMELPLLGTVEFGLLYPLIVVPAAVTCVVNATNMLAGQNGLESSLGFIALSSVGIFAFVEGNVEGAVIAFGMAAPLLGFLPYNIYPSTILPGDSLTYSIGAAYVSAVIIGGVRTFGAVVFTLWIAEAFLKLRSGFQASSLGDLRGDGTLEPQHERIYSVTHVLMRFDLTEKQIVIGAALLQALISTAALIIFLV